MLTGGLASPARLCAVKDMLWKVGEQFDEEGNGFGLMVVWWETVVCLRNK